MKFCPPPIWTSLRRVIVTLPLFMAMLWPPASRAAAPVATSLGADSQLLQAPARIATDALGNLYVCEPQAGRVVVFDAFGRVAFVKAGLAGPLGLAVAGDGRIYLAEERTGSVSVFDDQWNLLSKLGSGDGEFALPNFIALDPGPGGTRVYVTDSAAQNVKVYLNGVFDFSFQGAGTNAFDFPAGICLSAAGELFIVDQNNDRVQVCDRAGGYLRQFTLVTKMGMGLGSAGGRSQGISGDNQGRLYVADSFQGFVRVYDTNGLYLTKIGGFGEEAGKFRTPAGLALDAFNRLFVASLNNSRAEIYGLDTFLHFKTSLAKSLTAEGSVVTFSVIAGGTGPFTYQWRKDASDLRDGGTVAGATNATLTLTGTALSDSGKYSVVVNGATNSSEADLTVLTPPVITQSPTNKTTPLYSDAAFSVVAGGSPPLSYQWQKDGTDLDGQTNSLLILSQVRDSSAGTYGVLVSNAVGVATASALLTITHPPTALVTFAATTLNTPLVFSVAKLLLTASSPEQFPLTLAAVDNPSVNGGSVSFSNDTVTYTPRVDYVGDDSFSYTIDDGHGGTATAKVLVTVVPPGAAAANMLSLALTPEGLQSSFAGTVGLTYRLQRTETLGSPVWTTVGQAAVGPEGIAILVDPDPPADGAFYRTIYP